MKFLSNLRHHYAHHLIYGGKTLLEWISSLDDLMKDAIIEKNKLSKNILRFKGASKNWNKDNIPNAGCEISVDVIPGHYIILLIVLMVKRVLEDNHRIIHGIIKSSLMVLGIEHLHEDQDILAISGWEALLDGLGTLQRIYKNQLNRKGIRY